MGIPQNILMQSKNTCLPNSDLFLASLNFEWVPPTLRNYNTNLKVDTRWPQFFEGGVLFTLLW